MPSSIHQGLVALLSNDPALAPRLLRAGGRAPHVPSFDAVTVTSGDLGEPVPSERRVDLALELRRRRRRVAASLIEVQLHPDPAKRRTWPHYYTSARDRMRCPVYLIVVAPTRRMATWSRQRIETEQMTFTPIVLGPDEIPIITDAATARAHPELAIISALIHGRGAQREKILAGVFRGIRHLDTDRRRIYTNLLISLLDRSDSTTPPPQEMTMNVQEYMKNFKITDPRLLKYVDRHNGDEDAGIREFLRDAEERNERDQVLLLAAALKTFHALATAILNILEDRKLAIPDDVRTRVLSVRNVDRLRRLQQRALYVEHAEDLLSRKRLRMPV